MTDFLPAIDFAHLHSIIAVALLYLPTVTVMLACYLCIIHKGRLLQNGNYTNILPFGLRNHAVTFGMGMASVLIMSYLFTENWSIFVNQISNVFFESMVGGGVLALSVVVAEHKNIMRLKSVKLIDFKRFDNLTINLGEAPRKIIALVGPNGCGKSSIFDAFEQYSANLKGSSNNQEPESFYRKSMYSEGLTFNPYNFNRSIILTKEDGNEGFNAFNKKNFYIRTAYRFTPKLKLDTITKQPDMIDDYNRPVSSISLDQRMTQNYGQMYGAMLSYFSKGNMTGEELRKDYIDKVNDILKEVLDIKISDLGDIQAGRGQLFFEKGSSKNFPYDNLSSGEKEVIDIIIDLF